MAVRREVAVLCSMLALLSCTHPVATPSPAPGAGRAASATPGTSVQAGQPAGAPVRRIPPSRDSLAKLRADYVAQITQQIAGRETQPAEQVFKNVQVLKGVTATELVRMMDKEYAQSMGWNCTNCHRLAPQGNWASDTSENKKRARFMQQMTNDLNGVQLPKLYPRDTPKVTCITCHRGYNEPPSDEYLVPERGKPGGVPFPPPRVAPPAGQRPVARPPL